MSSGAGVRLAWGVAGLTTLLLVVGIAGGLLVGEMRPAGELSVAVLVLGVGTVLTVRRPLNRVGWVYAVSAHAFAWLSGLGAFVAPGAASFGALVAWVGSWAWMLAFGLPVTFGLLWFPDGRMPTPSWRWLQRALITTYTVAVATAALLPFEVVGVEAPVANPLELGFLTPVLEPAFLAAAAGLVLCAFGCAASVAVRWRRAHGIERQQVKWMAYAGLVGVTAFLLGDLLTRLPLVTWDVIYTLAIGLPAVAVALALLRYRLYDIDRIISRTVAYALLSSLLAAVYVSGAMFLGQLLRPVTGGTELAVAASTLAAAALFGPLRRRVQTAVDRRFNRARYDAERVVAGLRDRLRDDVELEDVVAATRTAATGAVQPVRASLWLAQRGVPA